MATLKITALAAVVGLGISLAACQPEENTSDGDTSEAEAVVAEESPPIEMQAPIAQGGGDPIRGPGGLEEKCLARIREETGGKAVATDRIDESEATIEVYVDVESVEEPWRCTGSSHGAIREVMYTGSEGAA